MEKACSTFQNFGQVVTMNLGSISSKQAFGLSSLTSLNMVIMYLNLPGNNSAVQYGINKTMDEKFISQFPDLIRSYQQINNQLTEWNPSFLETALLTVMIFINGYSGNDPTMTNIQQRMSNACDLILWKLANRDLSHFETLRNRFVAMVKLLQQTKEGILLAMKITKGLDKVYFCMRQAEKSAVLLIESKKKSYQLQ